MRKWVASAVVLLSVSELAAHPMAADPLVEAVKLTASDGSAFDRFGAAVAVTGHKIVVGAVTDSVDGVQQGSAYVYVDPEEGAVAVVETAKLTASDGVENARFGHSVAVSEDIIAVGALWDTVGGKTQQGSAYVFVEPEGGWNGDFSESAKLTASDGGTSHTLGRSIAIEGDTVVAGAPGARAAYVFLKPGAGWQGARNESAKLIASDGEDLFFGYSVAISGTTVVVGSFGSEDRRGAVYVFVEPAGGWSGTVTETARLTASDAVARDAFGNAVAIDHRTVVVGARSDDVDGSPDQGSAYVFVEPDGGWSGSLNETAKLLASDGGGFERLGHSVAVSLETVIAGAQEHVVDGNIQQGAIYVFEEPAGGWSGTLTESVKLLASDGAAIDFFGGSVAISRRTVCGGALGDDIGANEAQGSAYVFRLPGSCDCTSAFAQRGTAGDDVLVGTPGADVLCGLDGADILDGLGGADCLVGGRGPDILLGGGGSDELRGDGGADLLLGEAGDDVLHGGGGKDLLVGGRGSDELSGGRRKDFLAGGAGADLLHGGRGGDDLIGAEGDDELHGDRGNDLLRGGTGDDDLRGGPGRDVCKGGPGDDNSASCEESSSVP